MRPERVGFQPYITNEVWERLKSAMRDYRTLNAGHQETKSVEAAILFYAGWLGHYVADGSQPLHVTIQYNGWVGANPNGYTTAHTIHSQFETAFVDAAVNAPDVQPLMTPVKTVGDEWDDYLAYLRHTGTLVEKVYQFEKQQGFEGAGTPEAKQFTAERLAAGASMLRDMIYAAWVKSAEPVPEWKGEGATPSGPTSANKPTDATGEANVASEPYTGEIWQIGTFVKPPRLVYVPNIQLDAYARAAQFNGVTVIRCVVDQNGIPRNLRVIKGIGHGLDQKALEAVTQYRFQPATAHGQPVAVEINIEVKFRMP